MGDVSGKDRRDFMNEMLKKILSEPNNRLRFLVDDSSANWRARSHLVDDAPGVQAGHLISYHSRRSRSLAIEDAFKNQIDAKFERNQATHFKIAIEIDGIPVERETARMYERLGCLPAGTCESAPLSRGWLPPGVTEDSFPAATLEDEWDELFAETVAGGTAAAEFAATEEGMITAGALGLGGTALVVGGLVYGTAIGTGHELLKGGKELADGAYDKLDRLFGNRNLRDAVDVQEEVVNHDPPPPDEPQSNKPKVADRSVHPRQETPDGHYYTPDNANLTDFQGHARNAQDDEAAALIFKVITYNTDTNSDGYSETLVNPNLTPRQNHGDNGHEDQMMMSTPRHPGMNVDDAEIPWTVQPPANVSQEIQQPPCIPNMPVQSPAPQEVYGGDQFDIFDFDN